jgi:peptidoglycan-associated lipoprotein
MKFKLFSILATSLILAGCCSDNDQSGKATNVIDARNITPGSVEDFRCNVGDRVFFAFNESDLTEEAKTTLRAQAEFMKKYPRYDAVVLVGRCDERGSEEYNMALGMRRANAAMHFLQKDCGISSARLRVFSKGKSDPLYVGNTEDVYAKNRVTVTVLNGDKASSDAAVSTGSEAAAPAAIDGQEVSVNMPVEN